MRNIEKADKSLEKVAISCFLDGRKCSFINGYYEQFGKSEININTWYDFSEDSAYVNASCFNNGWVDKESLKITSNMNISEITEHIFCILLKYRHISEH